MKSEIKFKKVCLKKDGHVSRRALYLFERIGKTGDAEQRVCIHPVHVSKGRGFCRLIDNLAELREIIESVGCLYTEGNDAPRGGRTGDFITFCKSDFLKSLQRSFGREKGREIYKELFEAERV